MKIKLVGSGVEVLVLGSVVVLGCSGFLFPSGFADSFADSRCVHFFCLLSFTGSVIFTEGSSAVPGVWAPGSRGLASAWCILRHIFRPLWESPVSGF